MERLWSLAVATGGNRWQTEPLRKGSNRRKPLPWLGHQSPPGLRKTPQIAANRRFLFYGSLHIREVSTEVIVAIGRFASDNSVDPLDHSERAFRRGPYDSRHGAA
jgi:hypothetical protein